MDLSTLTAISPLDGRYRRVTKDLADYFSESALIKYRVHVEIEYFIALYKLPLEQMSGLEEKDRDIVKKIRDMYKNFSIKDAEEIKKIEKVTNHDVKAVEYFIKDKFEALGIVDQKEFVHFGLTSQDINNTSVPLCLKDALNNVYHPLFEETMGLLKAKAETWKDIPMLAKTHGQPASPTRVGKEFYVFYERLEKQIKQIKAVPFSAKFGGATGNLNAHHVAYPKKDWIVFANDFVNNGLGLDRSQTTTQIEHYDNLGALFDGLKRVNTILIDLNRDVWTYISMDYFKQKIKEGEIGSSAMPHKINPIDFENSEGNLGLANAIFEHLAAKLPISRLQRDLTDSTVLRNVGVPIGHCIVALTSLKKGLEKLIINEDRIKQDLDDNWAVVSEALQTVLRREKYPKPYEALKELTRTNDKITSESISSFIDGLDVKDEIKQELKNITPFNFTGLQLI